MTAPIRVVVADDVLIVREGIVRLLEHQPEVEVLASCADVDSLLDAVDRLRPDVVLTDIRMPPGGDDDGIRFAVDLRTTHPGVGVVVLSQHVDAAWAVTLLDGGSEGRAYLLKERVGEPEQLVAALREVAMGGSVVDPKVVESLMVTRTPRRSVLDELSPRELEVLAEIAQGKSNASIAESLYLGVRAVEKHINSLLPKLGLTAEHDGNRRVAAVLLYLAESGSQPVGRSS